MIYLMFTPTDSFSMRIVLVILLFLTVVGILIATAMLIYERCYKTEKCNNKKGLIRIGMLRASCLTLEIDEFGCYEAKIEESEHPNSFISNVRQDALSIKSEKTTQNGFFPDGENFPVDS